MAKKMRSRKVNRSRRKSVKRSVKRSMKMRSRKVNKSKRRSRKRSMKRLRGGTAWSDLGRELEGDSNAAFHVFTAPLVAATYLPGHVAAAAGALGSAAMQGVDYIRKGLYPAAAAKEAEEAAAAAAAKEAEEAAAAAAKEAEAAAKRRSRWADEDDEGRNWTPPDDW